MNKLVSAVADGPRDARPKVINWPAKHTMTDRI